MSQDVTWKNAVEITSHPARMLCITQCVICNHTVCDGQQSCHDTLCRCLTHDHLRGRVLLTPDSGTLCLSVMKWVPRRRGENSSGHGGRAGCDSNDTAYPPSVFKGFLLWAGLLSMLASGSAMEVPSFNDNDVSMDDSILDPYADDFVTDLTSPDPSSSVHASSESYQPPFESRAPDNEAPADVEQDQAHQADNTPPTPAGRARHLVFHNRFNNTRHILYQPFGSLQSEDSRCICSSSEVEAECPGYTCYFSIPKMCRDLDLYPGDTLHNDTLGEPLQLVYPWEGDEYDSGAEDARLFDDQFATKYIENPNILAWFDHCYVRMKVVLHRHGPFEYDIRGTSTVDGRNKLKNHIPSQEEFVHGDESEDAQAPTDEPTNEGDPSDEGPGLDEGENASDSESSGSDNFEDNQHKEIFGYLTLNIFPVHLRGNGKELVKARKTWSQNARRRYTIRVHEEDNSTRCSISYYMFL
jgi:hypothetical protein